MIEITGNVKHDGESFVSGDKIEKIKEEQAQRLVDLGVAFFIDSKVADNDKDPNNALRKEIDEAFGYADLKEAALAVGLEFPGNISMQNLIDLVINEGKAEEVFSITEEDDSPDGGDGQ